MDRDRVTQWHQIRRALRRHDPGDSRDRQRIALGQLAVAQQSNDLSVDDDAAARSRRTNGDVLARHVDHARITTRVQVGEFTQRCRRSSSIVDTMDPASSSVLASGTTTRALAPASDAIRCEPLPPTGVTTYSPFSTETQPRA